jgi:hypothetical protein
VPDQAALTLRHSQGGATLALPPFSIACAIVLDVGKEEACSER